MAKKQRLCDFCTREATWFASPIDNPDEPALCEEHFKEHKMPVETPYADQTFEHIQELLKPWLPPQKVEELSPAIKSLLESMELRVRLDQTERVERIYKGE